MTWRYVMSVEETHGEKVWAIRSLHTDPHGRISWSKEPTHPQGSTWLELYDDLSKMTAATGQVLDLTVDPPELRARKSRKR